MAAAKSKSYDLAVDGLNDVMRALRQLPKEASSELRKASKDIAANVMVPAWRNAALYYAGSWGEQIAGTIRAKSDRVPAVMIGYSRPMFSGGASTNMVRYPVDSGEDGQSWYDFPQTNWISKRRAYQADAIKMWAQAVDRVIARWSVM